MTFFSETHLKMLWHRPGGYREILALALPLVISTGAHSIQMFTDSVFLNWYSSDAMSASMPGGLWSFTFICFFMGTASYVNTFIAQYHGAGRTERIGPALWQAVYFALGSAGFILSLIPFAPYLFDMIGHPPAVQALETTYFRILCAGGFFVVYSNALSAFFTGRGRTGVVMWVTLATTGVNVVLNYAWIFGHFGFPEWGIAGAAWATVVAGGCNALVFTILVLSSKNRRTYATWKGRGFDRELFGRLMRFGVPNGIQFILDMATFTLFVSIIGRLGAVELAASVMAFRINLLGFLPMLGFSIAVSTLVGQRLGENRPDLAARATWSTFTVTMTYMVLTSLLYVLAPGVAIAPFGVNVKDPAAFAAISSVVVVLLRFVAFYNLFDALNLIMAGALKGAGDTAFVMWMVTGLGFGVMVLPTSLIVLYNRGGLYASWGMLTVYVVLLGGVFLLRFLGGKWRDMRVIETPVPSLEPAHTEAEHPPV